MLYKDKKKTHGYPVRIYICGNCAQMFAIELYEEPKLAERADV
jgi:uncharacterized protein YlaI